MSTFSYLSSSLSLKENGYTLYWSRQNNGKEDCLTITQENPIHAKAAKEKILELLPKDLFYIEESEEKKFGYRKNFFGFTLLTSGKTFTLSGGIQSREAVLKALGFTTQHLEKMGSTYFTEIHTTFEQIGEYTLAGVLQELSQKQVNREDSDFDSDLEEIYPPQSRGNIAKRTQNHLDLGLYQNKLQNREFGKEAPQDCDLKLETIAKEQGLGENCNSEANPMMLKTDSSDCFSIFDSEDFNLEEMHPFQRKASKAKESVHQANLKQAKGQTYPLQPSANSSKKSTDPHLLLLGASVVCIIALAILWNQNLNKQD